MKDIEIYKSPNGNTEISVKLNEETVWLSQQQMAELFETSRTNIVEHIKHIYEEGELEEISTCRKFRQVQYNKETKLAKIRKDTSLRKSILQAAITGKLKVDNEKLKIEETGKQLLDRIIEERKKMSHGLDFANAKSGKRKSKKETALAGSNPCDIPEDEIPFEIPESWCWCRWGELSDSIQYGYNAPAKESGRIKMVRITDIQDGKVQWEIVPYCEISEEEILSYKLKKNDILFARTGGTVGKSFLVDEEPEDAVYAGYLIRTQYDSEKLNPKYLKMFMESQLYWEQLKNGTIATAQPNCNGQTLSKMIIPLPPLAEQNAIVEALEELLPLCENIGGGFPCSEIM